MKYNEIPLLSADEVECRVQSVNQNRKSGKVGAVLLLYKDARVDMKILDQVYGPGNWQRTHEMIGNTLYCNIDIWDEDKKCWIRKQDAGVESNTEKEKGRASDSFKRAGFNVGIGRELYTAPFTYVQLNDGEYYQEGGKFKCSPSTRFEVSEIGYDDKRRINRLIIVDSRGTVRYELKAAGEPATPKQQTNQQAPKNAPEPIQSEAESILCSYCGKQIVESKSRNGRLWKPEDIAAYTNAQFGRVLCPACQRIVSNQNEMNRA